MITPQKLLNNLNFDIKNTEEYEKFDEALYWNKNYEEDFKL